MSHALTQRSSIVDTASSAGALRAQIQLIQQVMREVMIEGVHYGRIAGTPKPTLLKPGAEVLCAVFHISQQFVIDDLSLLDVVRYRVRCIGKHQATGIELGEGVGECSSDEAKYRWRAPVCDEEFDETPADRRREKWMRGQGGSSYRAKQIRTEPADQANTVLKMAAKRSLVSMVLNVTAASDIFSQDLEDLPDALDADGAARPSRRQPKPARGNPPRSPRAAGGSGTVTDAQVRLLRAKLADAGMSADDVCRRFGIESITVLPFDRMNDALAFIADPERDAIQAEAAAAEARGEASR